MSEARLSSLRRKRGTVQGAITTFVKILDRWEQNEDIRDADYLQVALESMQRAFRKFDDLQDELEELDETETEKRETIQTNHDKAVARARKYLRNNEHSNGSNRTDGSSTPVISSVPVTLPTITLPTFDGSVEGWASFYDIFSAVIDKNNDLSPVRKLQYLRLSLKGKAAHVIDSLETTDSNYDVALTLLKNKFECTRRTVRRHWAILRELPKLPKDTPAGLSNLVDTFQQHIRALEIHQAPVDQWDIPLVDLILTKISSNTVWQWELGLTGNDMPSYKTLLAFLEKRASCVEFSNCASSENTSFAKNRPEMARSRKTGPPAAQAYINAAPSQTEPSIAPSKQACPFCSGPHTAYRCASFQTMPVDERQRAVANAALCFNCLGRGHGIQDCPSSITCKKCKRRHHSFLHRTNNTNKPGRDVEQIQKSSESNEEREQSRLAPLNTTAPVEKAIALIINSSTRDMLVTAVVKVCNQQGQTLQCRTLLDSCSTSNFISEKLANSLGLPRRNCAITISGRNDSSTASMSIVTASVHSRITKYHRTMSFYTVPSISRSVPNQPLHRSACNVPKNLQLADPEFHRPAPVDMLLGSGFTLSILCVGQLDRSSSDSPGLILQKTQLGWVIGGSPPSPPYPLQPRKCFLTSDMHFELNKFWEVEEGTTVKHRTKEEEECEQHFVRHVTRAPDGRYSVALPFNAKITKLGESKSQARKRLKGIERKLNYNADLRAQYNAVLQEYIDLGHMYPVNEKQASGAGFYLPHHAVVKEGSLTTAVRVVFDGSAKSSTGVSLNDTLLTGPTIQSDLFTLILRFRKYPFVITGDIEKMYRQFLVRPDDRKYQRILWKNNNGQEQTYELNTVTFGLTSAPYLAIRCLHQLAEDEQDDFPRASRIIREDFYVDDAITGADTIEEIITIRDQLTKILERGQLKIRQWASNAPEALEGLPKENINKHLLLDETPTIKTLGVRWISCTDTIIYNVKPLSTPTQVTKRTILSETARIFDPLGLLAPVITLAKIIMQRLWILKLDWDESLPSNLHTEWLTFHSQLQLLNDLKFNRKVRIENATSIELHGFCDASERAYGACLYVRSTNQEGNISTILLCSKSRVAPVKTLTIPRLELCGALLLTTLVSTAQEALQIKFDRVICWTDSTIVLHWLQTSPQSLKTFVANRVSEIQSKSTKWEWRHIRSHDNPADLVSRGLLPEEFIEPSRWQQGPPWLILPEDKWPTSVMEAVDTSSLEVRTVHCFHLMPTDTSLLTKYSSLQKLERIVAYCRRLLKGKRENGPITVPELHAASQTIIRLVQQFTFANEMHCLRTQKPLDRHSRLLSLNPKIDNDGILRVGGRLKNANMPFVQRHPIILPKSHHVTRLIIESEHRTHLHAGIQATLYALRRRYWIIDGRNEVRKIVRTCITCCRLQPPTIDYLMGDLPAARVTQARPFSRVGIDYCGPFFVKEKKLRNRNKVKVYVAIFVCLSVKAVHLEVVSDLSTDAFLAALRRFIARRGICSDIYSDNGTNFVGAHNDLKELHSLLTSKQHQQRVDNFVTLHKIKWHFIPARAPNFGGIWEAAVKSFKHHLRRVVGTTLFTYEEFNTFTIDIEAVLNSRPLTPISTDPNDLLVLTPGHFLIGESLTSLPEQDLRDVATNRLSNWQHIQQVRQHFWSRWSREYINELTVRHKWSKDTPTVKEGAVVVLKEDNLPPLQWVLGRITKIHPGSDGITRVVTVRTARGTFDRSVKKVAPLPIQADDNAVSQDSAN